MKAGEYSVSKKYQEIPCLMIKLQLDADGGSVTTHTARSAFIVANCSTFSGSQKNTIFYW
ncbi:MAG: hypothetical protein HYV28_14120 [Ignavibacteriales bacterium]|nr:hypothetical protein [Ignavibacteriales bacterium]